MTDKKTIVKSFSSKGVFPYQMAFTLLIPFRNLFLSPHKLTQRLELSDTMTVLEVGCGPGFYSLEIAQTLINGKLVLADIQPQMLKYARRRINKKKLSNVEYYLCNGVTFDFSDNTFDRVVMVTVIGEVENKSAYLRELYRVLKPNGRLSITELAGDPDKLTINELKNLVFPFGFAHYNCYGNERNYTINFIKGF